MSDKLKQTAFRFTKTDFAYLDAIQKHTGISTRTDAIRAILRIYARSEGLKIPRQTTEKINASRA